jgi:hypothetical protein
MDRGARSENFGHGAFEQSPTEAKTERGCIKRDGLLEVVYVDIDHYLQSRRLCYDAQRHVERRA